jgi:cytochrome c oxidase assembly protein subunit 15
VGLRRQQAPPAVQRSSRVLLAVLVAQAAVGYTQYFTGVPALLVGVHILGAVAVWSAVVALNLAVSGPTAVSPAGADAPPAPADAPALAGS